MSELYNVTSSPHIRAKDSTQRIMLYVIIALLPATVFGIINFGPRAMAVVVVSIASCLISEYLYNKIAHKKQPIGDLSCVVTGLLLGLNLSHTVPFFIPIIGGAFAIDVVKMIFGGLGQNFMNPALAARCFLLIAYTGPMTNFVTSNGFLDAYSGATPLALLKPGAESTGVVSLAKMFIGTTGGVIGETSAICLLLGGIYLLARKVINWRIPVIYVGVFAALIFLFAPGHHFDVIYMLEEVCGGGLLLGAIFMATDYVTSPITPNGKIVFGCCLGLLTFIFRMYGGSAEGVSYAIIFCNLLVPLIERVTVPKSFGKKKPEKKAKEAA